MPAAEELPTLFADSARASALPGSWQANRRFYLLVHYYAKQGFARCIPFRKAQNCNSFPRLEQQSFPRKETPLVVTENTRIPLLKNLILKPASGQRTIYILDYTGEESRAAQVAAELLYCLQEKPNYLAQMPQIIFAEGPEGVAHALQSYPQAKLAIGKEKKCFLYDSKI